MPLTETQIKNLKINKAESYKEKDTQGLSLNITKAGSKIWHLRYTLNGKDTTMSLGRYPGVSLREARRRRDECKQLAREGINPKEHRDKEKSGATTFNDVFNQWLETKQDGWTTNYTKRTLQRANSYLLKPLGSKPIDKIEVQEIVAILQQIDRKGLGNTIEKVKGIANGVFRHAYLTGLIQFNPVREISNDIFSKRKKQHYATITDPAEIGQLLRVMDAHIGSVQVKIAILLAPHVFLRPGELVGLLWSEIDFNEKIIRIDGSRMKMNKSHLVPMSNQVFKILSKFRAIEFNSPYVFPGLRDKNKHISTNSILVALRSLGIDKNTFTTHGFRHMASTRLNEMGFRGDIIEMQLAHRDSNTIRDIYNHATYLDERKDMMQTWSDFLDKAKENTPT